MKQYVLLFILVNVSGFFGYAHKTDEAFFTFDQKENTVEIHAEFPYTMRNALIEFNPYLENSNNKRDFEKTFVDYIKANLILTDKKGNILNFKGYKELDNYRYSHSSIYQIVFSGKDFKKVTNSIMFNVFKRQVNYNTVTVNGEQEVFTTNIGKSYFWLAGKYSTSFCYLDVLYIPVLYIIYRWIKICIKY